MLQDIRKSSQGTVAKIIVGLIVVVFALFGVESIVGGISGEPEVANVNGQEISQSDFLRAVEGKRRQILAQLGDKADPDLIDESLLRSSVLEGMINEAVLVQDSDDKGMFVSEMAVDNYIRSIEQFQVDGEFNNERMQMLLRNAGLTLQAYRESLKSQFVLGQTRTGIIASAFTLENELNEIVALDRQTRSFGMATVFKKDYIESVTVTDDEVSKYYDENKDGFKKPESVAVSYIVLDKTLLAEEVKVSDEDVKALYESEKQGYQGEEQRAASHILIKIDDEISDAQALEKIKEVKARLDSGEKFEDLAKSESQDEGSAQMGGSLGLSGKGVYVADFENTLYGLKLGEVSNPVKTEFGYHLIRLDKIEANNVPEFAEMQQILRDRLQKQKIDELFVKKVETLSDIAYSSPDLVEAAESLGLQIQTLVGVSAQTTNSLFSNRRVQKILFSPELVEEKHNSEVVDIEGEKALVFRVDSYSEASIETLANVMEQIRDILKAKKSAEYAKSVGDSFIERVKGGELPSAVSDNMDLNWKDHDDVRRDNVMLNRQVVTRVFTLPKETADSADAWISFSSSDGDYVVLFLRDVKEGSKDEANLLEKSSISRMIGDTFGAGDYQAYQKNAIDSADIERKNKTE